MFPPIDYLEWLRGRPEAALYDLARTELRTGNDDDPTPSVVPPALAELPAPPAGATLETQLATAYGVHPERVLVTAGASHANFLAMAAALDSADDADERASRVLVEKPGYEPLVRTPEAFGATVDRFRREPAADYALDPERVRNALDSRTALVVVTNRHNPSGRLADPETLAEVAEAAAEVDARVLVDEVTAPFVAEGGTGDGRGPFGGPTGVGLGNVIATNAVTKFPGFPELSLGWLVADPEFVATARRIGDHVPTVAETSVAGAMRALHAADDLAADAREQLVENHRLLAEFVAARNDLSGTVRDGAPFAFLDPSNADGDALATAAEEAGILLVPGRFFEDDQRVRVSVTCPPEDAAAALGVLGEILDGLRG